MILVTTVPLQLTACYGERTLVFFFEIMQETTFWYLFPSLLTNDVTIMDGESGSSSRKRSIG